MGFKLSKLKHSGLKLFQKQSQKQIAKLSSKHHISDKSLKRFERISGKSLRKSTLGSALDASIQKNIKHSKSKQLPAGHKSLTSNDINNANCNKVINKKAITNANKNVVTLLAGNKAECPVDKPLAKTHIQKYIEDGVAEDKSDPIAKLLIAAKKNTTYDQNFAHYINDMVTNGNPNLKTTINKINNMPNYNYDDVDQALCDSNCKLHFFKHLFGSFGFHGIHLPSLHLHTGKFFGSLGDLVPHIDNPIHGGIFGHGLKLGFGHHFDMHGAMSHLPSFHMPHMSLPNMHLPHMELPHMHLPSIHFPSFGGSSKSSGPSFLDKIKGKFSNFNLPKLSLPHLHVPELNLPSIKGPKFNLPSFNMPKFNLSGFKLPSFASKPCTRIENHKFLGRQKWVDPVGLPGTKISNGPLSGLNSLMPMGINPKNMVSSIKDLKHPNKHNMVAFAAGLVGSHSHSLKHLHGGMLSLLKSTCKTEVCKLATPGKIDSLLSSPKLGKFGKLLHKVHAGKALNKLAKKKLKQPSKETKRNEDLINSFSKNSLKKNFNTGTDDVINTVGDGGGVKAVKSTVFNNPIVKTSKKTSNIIKQEGKGTIIDAPKAKVVRNVEVYDPIDNNVYKVSEEEKENVTESVSSLYYKTFYLQHNRLVALDKKNKLEKKAVAPRKIIQFSESSMSTVRFDVSFSAYKKYKEIFVNTGKLIGKKKLDLFERAMNEMAKVDKINLDDMPLDKFLLTTSNVNRYYRLSKHFIGDLEFLKTYKDEKDYRGIRLMGDDLREDMMYAKISKAKDEEYLYGRLTLGIDTDLGEMMAAVFKSKDDYNSVDKLSMGAERLKAARALEKQEKAVVYKES